MSACKHRYLVQQGAAAYAECPDCGAMVRKGVPVRSPLEEELLETMEQVSEAIRNYVNTRSTANLNKLQETGHQAKLVLQRAKE